MVGTFDVSVDPPFFSEANRFGQRPLPAILTTCVFLEKQNMVVVLL